MSVPVTKINSSFVVQKYKMEISGSSLINLQSVLVGLVAFLVIYRIIRRPRNIPPGPMGWPLLGYLPQMAMAGEDPHVVFSKLAGRYGDVISVNIAGHLVVILHGYETVKEAFGQHQQSARPQFHISGKVFPGVGVAGSSGEMWTELRRFCSTVLRGFGVGKKSFEEKIATEAEFLIGEMKKTGGAPMEPRAPVGSAVSNVICSVVFGNRFEYTDPTFQSFQKSFGDLVEGVGGGGVVEFSPFIARLKFLPFVKKYTDTLTFHLKEMEELIKKHNVDYDADNPRDLVDMFLRELDMNKGAGVTSKINKENLTATVSDIFGAGSETAATTLRWCFLYMMAYPEVQARVQKELDDVTGCNRFPKISDKPNLPYTEAVLCEIQRISTTAPLALPHFTSEDTTVLGFNIPKGTIVIANLWHNHLNPSVWEEPQTFRPERFLDQDGKLVNRQELTPFGIGRRICLGEPLAKMELFIFFTFLMQQFTLKNPPDSPPVSFEGVAGVTWSPLSFKMCAIPRG